MQTDTEQVDAERVSEALNKLQKRSIKDAETILRDICSRCPAEYQSEFVIGATRYVKLWDEMQFMAYVASLDKENKETVVWRLSVYPRACYYLAFVLVEKQDFAGAMTWLNKGRVMEPHNPKFFIGLGVAHAHMKQHQKSYESYRQAHDLVGTSGHDRAVALRGMGVQLIDLRRLDAAEACLRVSLQLDSDNANAQQELAYIARLRPGATPAQSQCEKCGGPYMAGTETNIECHCTPLRSLSSFLHLT